VLFSILLLSVGGLAAAGAMTGWLDRDKQRISLLRAMGADEGRLLGEYLQQATILGAVAGFPGVLGGWAVSAMFNRLGPSGSVELLSTPRSAAGVFFLIVLAAIVAAVVPVSRAVRQDVMWLLRSASLPGNTRLAPTPSH